MPIMDGYEACNYIYDYLTKNSVHLPSEKPSREGKNFMRPNKTLIYCMTADVSPEAQEKIAKHPFDDFINNLGPNKIKQMLGQIRKKSAKAAGLVRKRR
jgi:hypothetical protein